MHNFHIVLKYYYIIVVKIYICNDLVIFSTCWISFVYKKFILYYIWKIEKLAKVVLEMWFTLINCRNIFLVSLNSQQFNSFQSINYFIYTTLTILIYEKTSREFIVKDHFVRNISEEFSWNSLKYTEIVLQNNYQKSMPFLMADNTIYQSKLKCGLFSECQYNQ